MWQWSDFYRLAYFCGNSDIWLYLPLSGWDDDYSLADVIDIEIMELEDSTLTMNYKGEYIIVIPSPSIDEDNNDAYELIAYNLVAGYRQGLKLSKNIPTWGEVLAEIKRQKKIFWDTDVDYLDEIFKAAPFKDWISTYWDDIYLLADYCGRLNLEVLSMYLKDKKVLAQMSDIEIIELEESTLAMNYKGEYIIVVPVPILNEDGNNEYELVAYNKTRKGLKLSRNIPKWDEVLAEIKKQGKVFEMIDDDKCEEIFKAEPFKTWRG